MPFLSLPQQWLEGAIRDLSATYPARAVGLAKFDIRLSHLLMGEGRLGDVWTLPYHVCHHAQYQLAG